MSEIAAHTPGPWRWEFNPDQKKLKLCGGVPRYDLTLLDFVRSGMQGGTARFRDPAHPNMNVMELAGKWAAPELGREHHAKWFALIDHPDARLIASAPDLLAACQLLVAAQDGGDVGDVLKAMDVARAAVAKATGSA